MIASQLVRGKGNVLLKRTIVFVPSVVGAGHGQIYARVRREAQPCGVGIVEAPTPLDMLAIRVHHTGRQCCSQQKQTPCMYL